MNMALVINQSTYFFTILQTRSFLPPTAQVHLQGNNHTFIHSFQQIFIDYSYVPNILSLAEDISVNKTKIPAFMEFTSTGGRQW